MSAITYFDAFLAQASDASQIDNDIRDFAQDIALGLSTSMRWPGSGGGSNDSAGEMLPGTARIGSAMTNPTTSALTRIIEGKEWPNGTLMWHQRSAEHVSAGGFAAHSGSENTFIFGGSKMEVHDLPPVTAVPYDARWLTQTGTADLLITDSAVTEVAVSFPTPYNDIPFVVTAVSNAWIQKTGVFAVEGVSDVTAGGFVSKVSIKGAPSFDYVTSLQWMAEGKANY